MTESSVRVFQAPGGLAGTYEYKSGRTSMAAAQALTPLFTDPIGSVSLSITIQGAPPLPYDARMMRLK